jgi:hypothetical protein
MLEDTVGNPEADNFYYIRLLLESFNKLGRLNVVVESIEQRMPTELFRLVDRTYTEIDQRHRNTGGLQPGRKGGHGFGTQDDESRQKIISDFLSTLYSKFEAIAEGHRVLHDVIEGMLKRENVKDTAPLTGGFKELWKLYQNEVRRAKPAAAVIDFSADCCRYELFSMIILPQTDMPHFVQGKISQELAKSFNGHSGTRTK